MPAAGAGRRLATGEPKALAALGGRALLAHAVEALEANDCTTAVVVVSHADAMEATAKLLAEEGFTKVTAVVAGGPTRQASVAAGLRALPDGPGYVAVHDVARPLVGPGAVDRLLELLRAAGPGVAGVVPGVAVVDTIREIDAGNVHVNWTPLWRADLMPYGGLKGSGIGKEGPRRAVAEMTEEKTVVLHGRPW